MDEDFTAEERERLREVLKAHERAAWFWATTAIWIKWIGGVLTALVAFKVLVGEFFKGLAK